MKIKTILAAMAVVMAAGCAKEQGGVAEGQMAAPQILAEMAEQPATRTCIDSDALVAGENTAVLWMPGDQLGVFTSGSTNVLYTNDEQTENIPNASFSSDAAVSGEVQYAYYPYDAANDGKAATALTGTIPAEQTMGQNIPADYKYGKLKAVTAEGGYKFRFHNMFSLVRFKIDATGTALEGKTLESVTMTVTRDGAAVPVTGDFKFSAVDGTYTEGTTSNELKTVWNQTLDGELSSFATVFPEVQSGDKLTFTFKAGELAATLTVTSKADFAPEMYYTFPLTLANFSGLNIVKNVNGNFTAATLNVDGLPEKVKYTGILIPINYTINEGAPGSDGTKTIGTYIANSKYDFVGCSEDFNYHSELASAMTGYTWGTPNTGTIPSSVSSLSIHIDTDGLSFATRNETCSFSDEYIEEFTTVAGNLTSGANTNVDKGFRHYVVTMKDGAKIDVIISHMNTYSSSGNHKNAQHAQLTQIAEYINKISAANKRPIIFMGDTNCRYTRHDFQSNFWGKLNSVLTWADPWVDFHRGGTYPTYGTRSLMIRSNFAGDTDNDIVCSDDQRGEVVDKIIYFNVAGADVQIEALECYNDITNFTKSTESVSYSGVMAEDANGNIAENQTVSYTKYIGYADHFPVVAKFSYSGTITVE